MVGAEQGRLAAAAADGAAEANGRIVSPGVGCDGGKAVAIEPLDDLALKADAQGGSGVIDGGEELAGVFVRSAALDRQGALAGGGEERFLGQGVHGGRVKEARALEAGHGEDDGSVLAGGDFAEAGVDIAADALDAQVRAEGQKLGTAAEGAGAHESVCRQEIEGMREWGSGGVEGGEDQDVAGVFALGGGGDGQVGLIDQGHGDGQVFEAVDGEVDLVGEEGLFELAGEEALAARFVEGAVGDLVAAGFEDHQLDGQAGVLLFEEIGDVLGLDAGQGAAAGAELERQVGVGHVFSDDERSWELVAGSRAFAEASRQGLVYGWGV
jgi:hypothetical protein